MLDTTNYEIILEKATKLEDEAVEVQSILSERSGDTDPLIARMAGVIIDAIDLKELAEARKPLMAYEYAKAAYWTMFQRWILDDSTIRMPEGMSALGKALVAMGVNLDEFQTQIIQYGIKGRD